MRTNSDPLSTRRRSATRSAPPTSAASSSLTPRATEFYEDWERVASDVVALLRAEAGRNPYDRALSDLIGELYAQRGVPRPLGRPQRSVPSHRHQAFPPPGRRGSRAGVRGHGASRRPRTDDLRVHGGAKLSITRRAQPPRELDLDARSGVRRPGRRRSLSSARPHCPRSARGVREGFGERSWS
jgi:MmyB-like transcription regulator ligand binding domain